MLMSHYVQNCVKNRKPDTSAAWKAEAEHSKSEIAKLRTDMEELLKELSIAKDALSQQIVAGQKIHQHKYHDKLFFMKTNLTSHEGKGCD